MELAKLKEQKDEEAMVRVPRRARPDAGGGSSAELLHRGRQALRGQDHPRARRDHAAAGDAVEDRSGVREGNWNQSRMGAPQPFRGDQKGQADMLSGRGYYDAVMLHGLQLGPMLSAGVVRPIDDLLGNAKLADPTLDTADFIQGPYRSLSFSGGKQYGFINWNYNNIYWARGDLLGDPGEQAAFKAKYGYDLAPAKTMEQMRDIAEFFTRKKGATLAGKVLETDFYGIVLEGIKGGSTFGSLWNNFLKNYGGDI